MTYVVGLKAFSSKSVMRVMIHEFIHFDVSFFNCNDSSVISCQDDISRQDDERRHHIRATAVLFFGYFHLDRFVGRYFK